MKKILGIILVLTVCMMNKAVISAQPADDYSTGQYGDVGEPDGSGIPKDEPVSTTGSIYGYNGTFDINKAVSQKISHSDGAWDIADRQLIFWGNVIENTGTSSLAVRDSYIRGETAVPAAPLAGGMDSLLASGNIRATVALDVSQNYYINSTIASRSWSSLSTDAAGKVTASGIRELNLYLYGSEAITMDGGYGAYSDLLCNLYCYGSHIQAAETGIVSGTYGKVTAGTIEDGEKNAGIAIMLDQADKNKRSDKQLGSVIEGGRNALMIHSANLPEYWIYEGYSREEMPWRHAEIKAHKSTLRTDGNLDKGVQYGSAGQAYINHTAGSVILIKSTNAQIDLDECELIPDGNGTGALIHTVLSNDTVYMNAVPDGEEYPGIQVTMNRMQTAGNIIHEDYQRDLILLMEDTVLEGAMNEYDCSHWNEKAFEEGFPEYTEDTVYYTHHGLNVSLTKGSVWNVTAESHLSRLYTDPDCSVNGVIFLNGMEQEYVPGTTYEGDVVVKPAGPGETVKPAVSAEPETTQPATAKAEPETTQPATAEAEPETTQPATAEAEPETTKSGSAGHVHDWVLQYELLQSCTEDHCRIYKCSKCGEEYKEVTGEKATGHKMSSTPAETKPASCVTEGHSIYLCEKCGIVMKDETIPALGHDWVLTTKLDPTCTTAGEDVYTCSNCGETHTDTFPAIGHDWDLVSITPATCTSNEFGTLQCKLCGVIKTDEHEGSMKEHDYQLYSCSPATCTDDGQNVYTCTLCGDSYIQNLPSSGHDWEFQYNVPVTCLASGYDVYRCKKCGTEDWMNLVPASGHDYIIYPTPGSESTFHTYECTKCGLHMNEEHNTGGMGYCQICGYSGPFG